MKKFEIGEKVIISHRDDYPYGRLPDGTHFSHWSNIGNPYDGFSSVLFVVADWDEDGNLAE